MARINQLSFEVANLIAAGEVVERPASVVKELLENAIDAGATDITVEIKHGGVSLIRVADNGCGMSEKDLPLSILRHATSKISSKEDLESIGTLGFRGEALAATAAVSNLTIITKTKDAETGRMLYAEAGQVKEISEVGCSDGTTVSVEELFATLPARRKFLKKDVTETAAVTAVVEKIAISRPDIAFRYITDGILRFSTAKDGNLKNTLYALYGRDFASRLLSVSGEIGGVSVTGFVGRPDNARANRNMQNFFINGRYVKSKTVGAAIERAFTSYMAPERFPVAILFLTLPHFSVDVNVHPAKLEVKFENERAVFEAVYYAVRTALEDCVERPDFSLGKKEKDHRLAHSFSVPDAAEQTRIPMPPALKVPPSSPSAPTVAPVSTPSPASSHIPASSEKTAFSPVSEKSIASVASVGKREKESGSVMSVPDSIAVCEKYAALTKKDTKEETAPQKAELTPPVMAKETAVTPCEKTVCPLPEHRILGVAFHTYILVELTDERMLVIDQHAAHERILFEELLKKQKGSTIASIPLLLPNSITATPGELAVAEGEKESFFRLGFDYTVSGNQLHLLAIPADTTPTEAAALLLSLCADETSGKGAALSEEKRREKMLYQMACKAAIKGGRDYDMAHVTWLVEQVLSLPDITVCPHGRPIAFYLTKKELDRQFDRIK